MVEEAQEVVGDCVEDGLSRTTPPRQLFSILEYLKWSLAVYPVVVGLNFTDKQDDFQRKSLILMPKSFC